MSHKVSVDYQKGMDSVTNSLDLNSSGVNSPRDALYEENNKLLQLDEED